MREVPGLNWFRTLPARMVDVWEEREVLEAGGSGGCSGSVHVAVGSECGLRQMRDVRPEKAGVTFELCSLNSVLMSWGRGSHHNPAENPAIYSVLLGCLDILEIKWGCPRGVKLMVCCLIA